MRAGTETALTCAVQVFGGAKPHHAYLFANCRATRIKVLVHADGLATAKAMDYSPHCWAALTGLLCAPALPIDNNFDEPQLRPWAKGVGTGSSRGRCSQGSELRPPIPASKRESPFAPSPGHPDSLSYPQLVPSDCS